MKNGQRGIVRTVIIIVIAIIVLSYFGFDIKRIIESPQTKRNFGYVKETIVTMWNRYLAQPADYLWNDIFRELIWDTSVDALEDIKEGEPTIIEKNSPTAPIVDEKGDTKATP